MTTFRNLPFILIASAALSLTACGGDAAQDAGHNDDHSTTSHHDMGSMQGDTMTAMAMGRVISVDRSNGMVTIEHGPVKALDWPTMTMPFMVDPKHLATVKKGDFVDMAMMTKPNKDGKYVLSNISPMNIDNTKLSKECLSKMGNIKSLDHSCMEDIREAMPHKH